MPSVFDNFFFSIDVDIVMHRYTKWISSTVHRGPAVRRLEAEAGGVNQRHNCQWQTCVREVIAAVAASVESAVCRNRVRNVSELTLGGGLDACDHEHVFLAVRLSLALLFVLSRYIVPNLTEVKLHVDVQLLSRSRTLF